MASIINAATSGGLITTADTSGILQLQTAGTTAVTVDASQRAAFVAGTAALPAITTTGDTNTGIFFPAADTIAFAEGGAEAMRIDSSGNLGIGTSTVTGGYKAQINGNLLLSSTTPLVVGNSTLTLLGDNTSSTGLLINTSGNLGVGTTSPSQRIHGYVASGSIRSLIETGNTSSSAFTAKNSGETVDYGVDSTGGFIQVTGAKPLLFYTNATERARIDSSGNLLVGATGLTQNASYMGFSPANGFADFGHINGSSSGLEYIKFLYNATKIGSITQNGTTAVAYNTSSDYRLKNTIAPMTGALSKVALLKPVTYKWNADGSDGQGFIAHELAEVIPDCVTGEKDAVETYTDEDGNEQTRPVYQGIDTSFLVATLTAAIQEQQALIQSLKARLDAANL